MDPLNIGLFNLADKRLAWLDQRQMVLAQNVANADTPAWEAKDLKPFELALAQADTAAPRRTNALHMAGLQGGMLQDAIETRPPERAPDGNSVALDDELAKVADTEGSHELVIDLYRKYMGLFHIALGHPE